jgi:hypothetical protein
MAAVNTNFARAPRVTLRSAAKMIARFGTKKAFLLRGEPGIGKSSIMASLKETLGDKYDYIYIDCPTMDVPDVGMAMPDKESKQLEFFVNALFRLIGEGSKRPKVIMLDELGKCMGPVLLAFTRLILEHILCGLHLPDGSIVFATSNNAADGVGDNFAAHLINRLIPIDIKKDFDGWVDWAFNNNIHPDVINWTEKFSGVFKSYVDYEGVDANDLRGDDALTYSMIFNPNKPGEPFVSPRSLEAASFITHDRKAFTKDEQLAMYGGAVGMSAAMSMLSFFDTLKDLVDFEDIVKDPNGVPAPDTGVGPILTLNNCVGRISNLRELDACVTYALRLKRKELQMSFFRKVCKAKHLTKLVTGQPECVTWMAQNGDALL